MIRRRLPRVHWIGPVRISVVQLSPGKLAEALDEEETAEEDRSPGYWVAEDMTIYVDKTLVWRKKWEIFCHEAAHAAIDLARLSSWKIEPDS